MTISCLFGPLTLYDVKDDGEAHTLAAIILNHSKRRHGLSPSSLCLSSKCEQNKEESSMRLHKLARCDRRSVQGIMSGIVQDLVQSVTRLECTKEGIRDL